MFHLVVALIAIVFNSTYVDQDDLPVVSSWTRGTWEMASTLRAVG